MSGSAQNVMVLPVFFVASPLRSGPGAERA